MKYNISRFELVGAASVLLAGAHIATKRAGIDQNALILLGFAAFCFLLPEFTGLASRVKKVKIPWLEAEFDAEIKKFEAKVIEAEASQPEIQMPKIRENILQTPKAQISPSVSRSDTGEDFRLDADAEFQSEEQEQSQRNRRKSYPPPLHSSYVREYNQILASSSSHREKLVLAAILTERMIAETVRDLGLEAEGRLSTGRAIRLLRKEGLVSDQDVTAFDEFWKIRNSVVHGEIQEISDRQSSRILDLLWRLVKVFG